MARTVIVSYSELDSARQCPHKHQLSYVQRWQAPTTSKPLARGSLWHKVMEQHYNALKAAQDQNTKRPTGEDLFKVVAPLLIPQVGKQSEDQELIEWMYRGYVEQYGADDQWAILAVEQPAEFWLPTPSGGRSRFKLKMKIDLIVRLKSDRKIWVIDHKSGANLPDNKRLEIDDQFGLYTWGLQRMGKKVFGQIHNAARTQRNKGPMALEDRFRRTQLYRTDVELACIANEAYNTARARYGPGATSERNPNPDTCVWRCDFTDACLHGRKTSDAGERSYLESAGFIQDFTRH